MKFQELWDLHKAINKYNFYSCTFSLNKHGAVVLICKSQNGILVHKVGIRWTHCGQASRTLKNTVKPAALFLGFARLIVHLRYGCREQSKWM